MDWDVGREGHGSVALALDTPSPLLPPPPLTPSPQTDTPYLPLMPQNKMYKFHGEDSGDEGAKLQARSKRTIHSPSFTAIHPPTRHLSFPSD